MRRIAKILDNLPVKRVRMGAAIVLVGLLAVLTMGYADNSADIQKILTAAMTAANVQIEKSSIHCWGKLPQYEISRPELTALVQAAMQQLDVKEESYQLFCKEALDRYTIQGICQSEKENIMVSVEVLYKSKKDDIYLVINIEKLENQQGVMALYKQKARKIFQNQGSIPHISTCLVGRLDGKLKQDNFTARIQKSFQAIEADVTDTMEQPNLVSCSGFSPLIPEFVAIDGQKTNVNMAIRYSPYDNRTTITLGSPVITGEY